MSVTKTISQAAHTPSRLPVPASPASSLRSGVDTSNLSPGAAARYEKLMRSLDAFTDAVYSKALTLPERK